MLAQVEAGAAGLSQFDSPWGYDENCSLKLLVSNQCLSCQQYHTMTLRCREHAGAAQKEFLSESAPKLDDSAWDAYWGWDCAGPEGLCDRVYQHLKIPRGQKLNKVLTKHSQSKQSTILQSESQMHALFALLITKPAGGQHELHKSAQMLFS